MLGVIGPDKRGGLNGSMQHSLAVYPPESQIPKSFVAADLNAAPPCRVEIGVTPWDSPQRYLENSPYYYLDHVQTPLLIIHGDIDPNVPAHLSDELFVVLRRLGKRVEYAKYEHEGHSPEDWSYRHRVDYYPRVVNWFERYLAAVPSKTGAPSEVGIH